MNIEETFKQLEKQKGKEYVEEIKKCVEKDFVLVESTNKENVYPVFNYTSKVITYCPVANGYQFYISKEWLEKNPAFEKDLKRITNQPVKTSEPIIEEKTEEKVENFTKKNKF